MGAWAQLKLFPHAPRSVVSTLLPSAKAAFLCIYSQNEYAAVWFGVASFLVKNVLNTQMHAMLQVITSEDARRCTNLVLCVHAADHAVAAKLLFDRAIAAVWTLFEPRAHHFFCSLLIPNLRRVSDVVSSVCLQDSSRSVHTRCNWFCCVPFVFDREGGRYGAREQNTEKPCAAVRR